MVMLVFIYMGSADLFGTGRERKIQNENICFQRESKPHHVSIFILDYSLPLRSEQVNGAVANEIKHGHALEVIVVLEPRYD